MRIFKFILLFLAIVTFLGNQTPSAVPSCREIVESMLDSIKNIKTQTYSLKSTERVGDRLLFAESHVKINYYPKKIYFKSPLKGFEVLWVTGANKGNAVVHSKTLPMMNLDLDPYGSIMRKDQHHTIFDLGTHYIGSVIANTILKSPKDFDKHFTYAGVITWNKIECYQLIIEYPEYKYIEYVVGKGETVTSVAQKLNTSDFKIRYKNDLSSYFGTIKEGKKLIIPIPYSNKGIMYIDKKTALPINLKVYDEQGLFEAYEFYNMKTNVKFAEDEFSKSFKAYSF
jgi:outer membrane lipoprotein-sorting protein